MKPRRSQRPGFHTTAPTFGATPFAGPHAATPPSPPLPPPSGLHPSGRGPPGPHFFWVWAPTFLILSYFLFFVLVHFLLFLFLTFFVFFKLGGRRRAKPNPNKFEVWGEGNCLSPNPNPTPPLSKPVSAAACANLPQLTLVVHGRAHELDTKVFFECRTRKGFFRLEIRVFFSQTADHVVVNYFSRGASAPTANQQSQSGALLSSGVGGGQKRTTELFSTTRTFFVS